ncbi:MAG: PAS domain S-box protein [Chloroflexi bacterium]|nr:MAG: PAS domain S-box protein [Chloroflexota bacterium]
MSGENFEALYRIARTLHEQGLDIHKTLRTAISQTAQALQVQHGCLITFKGDGQIDHAFVYAADGDNTRADVWNVLLDHGLVGYVQYGRRTVIIRNIQTDPRWPQNLDPSFAAEGGSAIGVPLLKGQYVLGVLLLLHNEVDYFGDEGSAFLEEVAAILAAAIGNAVDYRDARRNDLPYQTLFDDAINPILLTDLQGYIIDANRKACDVLGYERSELLRMPISRIHRLDKSTVNVQGNAALEQGEEMAFRTIAITATGQEIPILVRTRRIKFDDRDVLEWVERDFTAQMELEQLRRDLSAMVYHDLRGPLQNIRGSLFKLDEVLASHTNRLVPTLLQLALRSTRQLQRMVDSLLDIQRLEDGHNILKPEETELRALLGEAIQLVSPIYHEAGQEIVPHFAYDLPGYIKVDSDILLRVILNLLENASKYTPTNSKVWLKAMMQDGELLISVRDSGPGIPADMLDRVFDKFSRVKHRGGPKGVGLGLAFCRLAVEAHGGQIWVESQEGQGAEFIFTLPPSCIVKSPPKSNTSDMASVS